MLLLLIGLYAARRGGKTSDEFFIAGRSLGPVMSFLSLTATFISPYLLMGAVGVFYLHGFFMTVAIVYTSVYGIAYWVIGGPLHVLGRRFGHRTPAELLGHYYDSRALRIGVALMLLAYSLPYLTMQYQALGAALEAVSGGVIRTYWTAAVLGVVVLISVLNGGFRSVAYADGFQTLLILSVSWGLGIYFLVSSGGPSGLFASVAAAEPARLTLPGATESYSWGLWFSFVFLYSWLAAVNPGTWQRAYAARDLKSWRTACLHTTWVMPLTYVMIMCVGLALRVRLPGLDGVRAETALLTYFVGGAPLVAGLVLLTTVTASNISPFLMLTSQYLVHDVIGPLRPDWSDLKKRRAGQLCVTALTVLALIALLRPPQFMILILAVFYGFACIVWPLLGVLFWERATLAGAMASMIVSNVVAWTLYLGGIAGGYPLGIHFIAWGILAGGVALVGVSLVTAPLPAEHRRAFHDCVRREFWGRRGVGSPGTELEFAL